MEGDDIPSIWAHKFFCRNIEQGRAEWNKDWEKGIELLKDPCEVYEVSKRFRRVQAYPSNGAHGFTVSETLQRVIMVQFTAKGWIRLMETGFNFVETWMLLSESARKKHILEGLECACSMCLWGQNARPLCPEITTAELLKCQGQPFVDILTICLNGLQSSSASSPYLYPSEWWARAIDGRPKPLSNEDKSAYKYIMLIRNEFIFFFIGEAMQSAMDSVVRENEMMDPIVASSTNKDDDGAKTMLKLDMPPIHCKNCAKAPKGLGPSIHFNACSACKVKLNIIVYYCSQECQKADWRTHKKSCGKYAA